MNCLEMPKVELHAHLNGSLSDATLLTLHRHKYANEVVESNQYQIFEKDLSMATCFDKFKFAHDLTDTPERLKMATKLVITDFASQNTIYLELRSTPRANLSMSRVDYISTILEAIIEMANEKSIVVRYLPSIDRAQTVEANEKTLKSVLEVMENKIYSQLIVGLDFSGNPAVGSFKSFIPLLEQARGCGLRLAIHCAEIPGQSEETKTMLESGLMDRIGHGTFLNETPELWSLFVTKGILVECCLSSNVKCGTVADFSSHHLQKLIRINNPLAICTDDFGVFDTTLSSEFEIAQRHCQLTIKDCEKITRDSIENAFCVEDVKEKLVKVLNNFFYD